MLVSITTLVQVIALKFMITIIVLYKLCGIVQKEI